MNERTIVILMLKWLKVGLDFKKTFMLDVKMREGWSGLENLWCNSIIRKSLIILILEITRCLAVLDLKEFA